MMHRVILVGLAGALAACGASGETEKSDENMIAEVNEAAAMHNEKPVAEHEANAETPPNKTAEEPDETPDQPANQLTDPAAPDQAARIPAAFHGMWADMDGACSPSGDMTIQISPQQIMFYESLGQVRSIEAKDEMNLDVTLAMEGEGEVWTNVTRLTLSDGGKVLTHSAGPGETAYEPTRRKKCPQ